MEIANQKLISIGAETSDCLTGFGKDQCFNPRRKVKINRSKNRIRALSSVFNYQVISANIDIGVIAAATFQDVQTATTA